jgi:NAD(P)-dependent dehydrogenase (short-subunit alcohol dehydrogenase family)
MDVTNEEQVRSVVADAVSRFGAIDILVNNAGVFLDREELPSSELLPLSILQTTLDVNLLGAARTMAEVIPVMIRQNSGVIVNVSSGMGRNVELASDAIYYRTSKAALTAITRCAAQRVHRHGIVVNAVCPGWVRTRMGGDSAVRSIEQGAEGIVFAALEPRKNGVLLRDSEDFGW